MPEIHEMKPHNEMRAVWASFPGCPRYLEKIADHPTCNSRKSVPVVLPALAEMLDLILTRGGEQQLHYQLLSLETFGYAHICDTELY
jgi:hypothetical protein